MGDPEEGLGDWFRVFFYVCGEKTQVGSGRNVVEGSGGNPVALLIAGGEGFVFFVESDEGLPQAAGYDFDVVSVGGDFEDAAFMVAG